MLQELKRFLPKRLLNSYIPEKDAGAAYDIWSENYDNQTGNLMLDLDEVIFSRLLQNVPLKNKSIADIGCGTGRHWAKMFAQQPAALSGFDVSAGMLHQLKVKYPSANTHLIKENTLLNLAPGTLDVVVSTLTVAHIKDLDEALLSWCRIVKNGGDILITDFHPDALAIGGKRTFRHGKGHIGIRNFVHSIDHIKAVMALKNWEAVNEQEIKVDENVKHYYEQQNALHVYNKFKNMPIIYGLHFKQA